MKRNYRRFLQEPQLSQDKILIQISENRLSPLLISKLKSHYSVSCEKKIAKRRVTKKCQTKKGEKKNKQTNKQITKSLLLTRGRKPISRFQAYEPGSASFRKIAIGFSTSGKRRNGPTSSFRSTRISQIHHLLLLLLSNVRFLAFPRHPTRYSNVFRA